jgi:hypothetical protein
MGIYIQPADVHGKAVDKILTGAGWDDTTDVPAKITEAEAYIEGCMLRIGFVRGQLTLAPATPCQIIVIMCINYARYCCLRDIFSNTKPTSKNAEPYEKWKTNVDDMLKKFEIGEMSLIDNNGNIINPALKDARYKVLTTTPEVKQAIKMGNDSHWKIDPKYEGTQGDLQEDD